MPDVRQGPANVGWVREIMAAKKLLFELARIDNRGRPVPRWMVDTLYVRGLDGDEPDENPTARLLTRLFFRGAADPIAVGLEAVDRWLFDKRKWSGL